MTMTFLTQIEETGAPEATAQMYATERQRVGYLPQYAQAFGPRPEVYAAWRHLIAAITSTMPLRRFELVTLAAARELRSTYCSVAHGTVLAERFMPTGDVTLLAQGGLPQSLDDQDRAVVGFAAKAARGAADITSADIAALRAHGLHDSEILDVVLATAARCFFSTVLDATGTQADAFYAEALDTAMREALTVGRPVADS
jgi:uncharacterized peroxidase-related enzyme